MIEHMVVLSLPGGLNLYAFSLVLSCAVASGLAWVAWRAPDEQRFSRLDGCLWALLAALLAARLGFLLLHIDYLSRPLQILNFFAGGFSGAGALLGGLFGFWLFAKKRDQPFAVYADALSPLLITLVVGVLSGCWLHGCLYAPAGWGLASPDAWGVIEPRPPIQVFGALAVLGGYYMIERLAVRVGFPAGFVARSSLLLVSLILLALSLLRVDALPGLLGLPLDAWVYLVLFTGCVLSLLFFQRRGSLGG